MPGDSKIGWTDKTWDPVTGCSKVSEGCRNCYAERISLAQGWTRHPWTEANAPANVRMHKDRLRLPYRWRKPARIFVNSMSDLFHRRVSSEFVRDVLRVISECPQHTFQILTKRPGYLSMYNWPGNAWAGVSVENRKVLDRLEFLKWCNAKVRLVSFEPLLGPIGEVDLSGIHWIIVGGESGQQRRKMEMAWARELRDQARAAGVPFFFKQDSGAHAGERPWIVEPDGTRTTIQEFPRHRPGVYQPAMFEEGE